MKKLEFRYMRLHVIKALKGGNKALEKRKELYSNIEDGFQNRLVLKLRQSRPFDVR